MTYRVLILVRHHYLLQLSLPITSFSAVADVSKLIKIHAGRIVYCDLLLLFLAAHTSHCAYLVAILPETAN
jgi:hypothetical protein